MEPAIMLSEFEIDSIKKLVEEKRRAIGFIGETPIAGEIFTILEKLGIFLVEFPIKSNNDKPPFSAAMIYYEESNIELAFLGLNTADYFDNQIFAIAHELYHFYTKTGSNFGKVNKGNCKIEALANRFAAEFLLPENALKSIIIEEFKTSLLQTVHTKKLLRFIARLQCTWWLPYRSLVRRIKEIGAINDEQYVELYNINERTLREKYGKIGLAINKEIFLKLNTSTKKISASPKSIEIIISNFEDNLIDEDKFVDTLNLFDKRPADFGYEYEISASDMVEFNKFFAKEADSED